MAKLSTIALSDTFGTWLSGANEAYARLNQFAINESSLYANTFSANVALQVNTIRQRVAGPITVNANTNIVGTFANVVSTNTNIAGGTLLVSSNVNFTGAGFQIQTGEVELYTDTGSPSYIKFFCENTNQHGIKIQSPTHAEMIGASNRALTIPAANGYLLWGSASDDSRQTLTSNVHFSGANVHFDGANVMYKGQLLDTRYANTTNLALKQTIAVERAALANTNAYIATMQTSAVERAALANTNAYIASMSTDVQLANTNAYIATKTTEATALLRLANTNAYIATMQTIAVERAALANTNAYIATMQTSAVERAALANTNTYIATMLPKAGGTMTGTLNVNAAINSNSDFKITSGGNRYIGIESTNGLATMEIGGATGAFIDLKHPYSDDNDMRIGTTTSGGYITTTGGSLTISANTVIRADSNDEQTFGKMKVSGLASDYLGISHYDMHTAAQIALGQSAAGLTNLNSASGQATEFRIANVMKMKLNSDGVTTYQQANGTIYTNMASTGNLNLNFKTYTHHHLKLTGNLTLLNPGANVVPGSSGLIFCKQDATGSRTLSLSTDFETPATAGITLSTGANDEDIIPYYVTNANCVMLGQIQRYFG